MSTKNPSAAIMLPSSSKVNLGENTGYLMKVDLWRKYNLPPNYFVLPTNIIYFLTTFLTTAPCRLALLRHMSASKMIRPPDFVHSPISCSMSGPPLLREKQLVATSNGIPCIGIFSTLSGNSQTESPCHLVEADRGTVLSPVEGRAPPWTLHKE